MLTVEQILNFINQDKTSSKKQGALIGERYYEGNHDIRNYKLYYFNDDGELVEDKTRSNIKISHPFFTELIDQKIQYLFSGDGKFFNSDDLELQALLDERLNENEDFKAELEEISKDASSKGFGYMFLYRDKEGHLAYQCADTMGVIEVRAKETQDNCDYVIYWYIDRKTDKGETIKKIQVWNEKEVAFYIQVNEGVIELDTSEPNNPRPHSIYTLEGQEGRFGEDFGFIPFLRLDNNRKQVSDLNPIKSLIDDYDLMACGLSNNIEDASEYVLLVKGFEGGSLDELRQNVKTKKAIGVGEGGDLDFKTVEIPYQARQTKLDLDEKNIYRFGMGFNSAQVGDGNLTNVVIKSRYALLDLKCNKFETQLRKFLRKILQIVLDEINHENGTAYQQKDVHLVFDREIMTNAMDNAQIDLANAQVEQTRINTLLNLASMFDNETLVQRVCEVLDIDYDKIKDKLPKDETDVTEFEKALNGVETEGVN